LRASAAVAKDGIVGAWLEPASHRAYNMEEDIDAVRAALARHPHFHVRHGSIKRIAGAVGEGAMVALLAQHRLEEIAASA